MNEGGTAEVFKVKEIETGKIYAAKVLFKKSYLFNKEKQFLNYIKQKNSPYIINIINDGTGDIIRVNKEKKPQQYIILEYASKDDLISYLLFPETAFGEEYAKLLFYKILEGVKTCHEAGVCHRDLKPENILVDENDDKIWNPKSVILVMLPLIQGN